MTKEQKQKEKAIRQLHDCYIEIISFESKVERIEKQLNDKTHIFYNSEQSKKDLQFTNKRLKLFKYHYENLLIIINK